MIEKRKKKKQGLQRKERERERERENKESRREEIVFEYWLMITASVSGSREDRERFLCMSQGLFRDSEER